MTATGISLTERTGVFVRRLWKSTALRQTSFLYVAQVMGLVLGLCGNLINTRRLGPADYGLYSSIFAVTELVTLFMDFGYFSSGARVLALQKRSPETQRRTIGALIVVGLALSCLGAVLLLASSFFVVQLLHAEIQGPLRFFCLLLGFLTLQTLVESVCRGTNRIEALSLFNVTWRGFGLLIMGLLIATDTYTLNLAVAATLVGSLAASWLTLSSFKPLFTGCRAAFVELRKDVKVYGIKAYTGDIAGTASSRTDSLILSHFVNPTAVGFYRLACLLTTPMTTFSRALSTTLFSRFADTSKIPSKVFAANAAWLGLCLAGLIVAGGPLVRFLFGSKYEPVIELIWIAALAQFLGGMAQPINRFLGAHGKGSYLRSIALSLTVCNLLLMFTLIPGWGVLGACYAIAASGLINLLLHYYYYRQTVNAR